MNLSPLGGKLKSENPLLNTCFHRQSLSTIVRHHEKEASRAIADESLKTQVINHQLGQFATHWRRASEVTNKFLAKFIKPEHYCLLVIELLELFLEDQIAQVKLQAPDKTDIIELMCNLRVRLACMRYYSEEGGFAEIKKFIENIRGKLRELGESSTIDPEMQKAWDAWETIYSDGDVLDLDVASLCHPYEVNDQKPPIIDINVRFAAQAYTYMSKMLNKNLCWVIEETEKLMEPFKDLPQYQGLNYSQKVLDALKDMRTAILPLTAEIIVDKPEQIFEITKKLNRIVDYLKPLFTRINGSSPLLGTAEDKIKPLCAVVLLHSHLPDDAVIPFEGAPNLTNKQLKTALAFTRNHLYCHILFDTYVIGRLSRLVHVHDMVKEWKIKKENRKMLPQALHALKLEYHPQAAVPLKSVDEVLLDAGLKDDVSGNQRKNVSQQSHGKKAQKDKKADKKEKKEKDSPQKSQDVVRQAPQTISKLLNSIEGNEAALHPTSLRLMAITRTFQSQEYRFVRIAARQSHMYFEDVQSLQLRLRSPCPSGQILTYASGICQSSNRLLEQQMQYLALIRQKPFDPNLRFSFHNLSVYQQRLGIPRDQRTLVLDQFRLANFWDELTYFQQSLHRQMLEERKRKLPEVLNNMIVLAELPNPDEARKVERIFHQQMEAAAAFAAAMEITDPLGGPVPSLESRQLVQIFKIDGRVSLAGLEEIKKAILSKLQSFHTEDQHHVIPLYLKQILKDLDVLKGNLEMLGQDLSSVEFSRVVRSIVHWESAIIQNMLQVLIYIRSGEIHKQHHLDELYDCIRWRVKPPEQGEKTFLKEFFYNAHQMSSYPFSEETIQGNLHKAILIAEMLRESPEKNSGFEEQKEKTSTPLNFIPLPTKEINVKTVVELLKVSFSGMMALFQNRLLPELRG